METSLSELKPIRNSGRGRRDYYSEHLNMSPVCICCFVRKVCFPYTMLYSCRRHLWDVIPSIYLEDLVTLALPALGLQSWQSLRLLLPSFQCSYWVEAGMAGLNPFSWKYNFPLGVGAQYFLGAVPWHFLYNTSDAPIPPFLPQYCHLYNTLSSHAT